MHPRQCTKKLSFVRVCALLLLAALTAGGLSACAKKQELRQIKLPSTPLLNGDESWAVVNSPLLRLRDGPSIQDKALITLRGGYVVEVAKRSGIQDSIGDYTDYWYYINFRGLRGWAFGHYLTMFDSRQEAEQAAKEFK